MGELRSAAGPKPLLHQRNLEAPDAAIQCIKRFSNAPGAPVEQAQPPGGGAEVEPAEVFERAPGHPNSTVLKSITESSCFGGRRVAIGAVVHAVLDIIEVLERQMGAAALLEGVRKKR
jgi:hypothetical protein